MAKTKHIASPSAKLQNRDLKKSRKWWLRWWAWLIWIFCALILLLIIAAAYIWTNRYALLKDIAIDTFAQDGIEAELDIESLSRTQAILKNVKLIYDGEVFFEAARIDADYAWRDALDGKMQSVSITEPRAHITIDKSGKIIDGWLPPSAPTESGAKSNPLPENGLTLTNGIFYIQSPYGAGEINGSVQLKSLQDFTAKLSLDPTQLTYNQFSLSGGGLFDMDVIDGKLKLDSQIQLSNLTGPELDAKNVTLTLNGQPDIEAQSFTGKALVSLSEFTSPALDAKELNLTLDGQTDAKAQSFYGTADLDFLGDSQIDWNGSINKTERFFDLSGDWVASLKQARIPDPARRQELATTLSFQAPLSKSPIAQNFVPQIRRTLTSLFAGSDIIASGALERNDAGMKLMLTAPAKMKSAQTQLTLKPKGTNPVYAFDRDAQRITAVLDASFTQPARLSLTDLSFNARSINGVRLDGVDEFRAKITTDTPWQSEGIDGRPARLSPLNLDMRFDGKNAAQRKIGLSGAVNYDGILPGGYVTGLQAAGDMGLLLSDKGQMTISYKPVTASRLMIDRLETATDWTAYDLKADIKASPSLLIRNPSGDSAVKAELSNITTQIRRKIEPASLDISAATLISNGHLTTANNDPNTLIQNWDMQFKQALITSDDLPGPDTKITISEGDIKANLTTGQSPNFDITTPSANVQTQLVKVDDMALRLHGQADNYDIEHSGGQVKLTGNELPPLPIEGQLTAKDGAFIGTAKARLPQADNTPISLTYNIKDGAGYADVDIEALHFTPDGLQPQSLISALRGKVAQVDGMASAKVHLEFARGQPLKSSGTAKIINMNLATAPGPLTNMNMELTMDSVLPLVSRGRQRITVKEFDPGIPLQDGVIEFELIDDGVKIYSAKWPIGAGFFSLDPFTWQYGAEENRLVLRLSDVQLGEFMESMGNDSIEATGKLQGEFPIVIAGVNLRVDQGRIFVKDGGTIRYNPPSDDSTPPISYTQEEAIKILRTKDQARYSSLARDALREFKYKELSIKVDGALDGEVELATVFNGSNQKVLNGQPFEFDINVIGELFNIFRSFDSNAQIKSQLEKQGISTEGLAIGDE